MRESVLIRCCQVMRFAFSATQTSCRATHLKRISRGRIRDLHPISSLREFCKTKKTVKERWREREREKEKKRGDDRENEAKTIPLCEPAGNMHARIDMHTVSSKFASGIARK